MLLDTRLAIENLLGKLLGIGFWVCLIWWIIGLVRRSKARRLKMKQGTERKEP